MSESLERLKKLRGISIAGRPPKNTRAFLDRQRPILAARYVRTMRKALAWLATHEVDATWVSLFRDIGDRVGFVRVAESVGRTTTTSLNATVDAVEIDRMARELVGAIQTQEVEDEEVDGGDGEG